jgi:hypothetical protein
VRGRDLVEESRAIVEASKKLRESLYHVQKPHAERSVHKCDPGPRATKKKRRA